MYDENNVFARILREEIPAEKVYEDDAVLAFYDISPAVTVHVIVIPKGKYKDYADFVRSAKNDELANFFDTVAQIAEGLSLEKTGYRLITNLGKDGHQTVPHFHVHILGGEAVGPLVAGDMMER